MEIWQESMTPLEGLQNDADSKTEEQPASGASMERVQSMLQMVQVYERLTATRPVEQVAGRGRWMLRVPPRFGYDREKRLNG